MNELVSREELIREYSQTLDMTEINHKLRDAVKKGVASLEVPYDVGLEYELSRKGYRAIRQVSIKEGLESLRIYLIETISSE